MRYILPVALLAVLAMVPEPAMAQQCEYCTATHRCEPVDDEAEEGTDNCEEPSWWQIFTPCFDAGEPCEFPPSEPDFVRLGSVVVALPAQCQGPARSFVRHAEPPFDIAEDEARGRGLPLEKHP